MSIFELLREHVDIVEVARRYTHLMKAGKLLRGRCPIHQDRSPSFFIYDGEWAHCFGCQFHGDVTDLYATLKGLQPIEAALELAHEFNIKLPERDPDAEKKATKRREKEASYEQQARACHEALVDHPEVKSWWQRRSFDDELQQRYLLGTSSNGMSAIIPYWRRGRVQGLIRRQLAGEPKYLVPSKEEFPEGYKPLFIPAGTAGDIHLVEGYVDALALSSVGLNSAAVGGTGLSEHQKAELLKFKGDIYILPDDDEEGARAARNWLNELYPKACLCPAEYGGRKDVADLVAAELENSPAIIEALKAQAVDALDLALREAPKGSTRDKWRYAKKHIIPLLLEFDDEGERSAAVTDTAKSLRLKASDLLRAVKSEMPVEDEEKNEPTKLVLHEPELWPDPVRGYELLDDLVNTTTRFVSSAEGVPETIALWSLFAHAINAFEISPLLTITSPEKRCGKTTLLLLVGMYVPRPLQVANITSSALFRVVEKHQPTLLIDEADTFLANNEELRGIINSGHRRAGAYVIRTVGDDHEPRTFCTWAAKAIALIGTMPDTLEDRSFAIRMQRRRPGENTEELRIDRLSQLESLRQRAARWAADNLDALKAADPHIPETITNARARDNWRVLLAIADAAGGRWPTRAREVALLFSSTEPDTESNKVLLLRDLKAIFDELGERLESEKIVTALTEIEGRPWAEGRNGKPLSKTGLARLLKPFKIHPAKWRSGDDTVRGYLRNDFEEAFARYLDIETLQTPHATQSTTYSQNETPHSAPSVAFGKSDKSNGMNDVARMAFEISGNGKKNPPLGFKWSNVEGVPLLVKDQQSRQSQYSDDISFPIGLDLDDLSERTRKIVETQRLSHSQAQRIALAEMQAEQTL